MQIGEKNFDFATSTEKLSNFDRRNEIGCVWATCSCCAPENLERAYGQDFPNDVRAEYLLNVGCDKVILLIFGED